MNTVHVLLAAMATFVPNASVASRAGISSSHESKIIGGQDVNPPNKYSSIVSLQLAGAHTCAGTILDKRWVITALHCVLYPGDTAPPILRVVAGLHNLNDTKTGADVQIVSVLETIRHPSFIKLAASAGHGPPPFDIALLRASPHFIFTNSVTPINLPPLNFSSVTKDYEVLAVAVGWGNGVRILQETKLPLITTESCQRKLGYFLNPKPSNGRPRNESWTVTRFHQCTQVTENGKGTCQGDSGGPLFAFDQMDGMYFQIGITSAAVECDKKDFPQLFTKLSEMLQWIDASTFRCKERVIA